MRAKYFHFLLQTNSALKIISAMSLSNLVKMCQKIVPNSIDERENFVTAEVAHRRRTE